MDAEESVIAKMLRLRHSWEQETLAYREKNGLLARSIRESIRFIKPSAENTVANRGEVAILKNQAEKLEASFYESLKVNASNKAKHTAISEADSSMVVRIEHLKEAVDDQRTKKEEYEAVLSQELIAWQVIEKKNEEDALELKNFQEANNLYKSVLGFQVEGGEGVKFTFNNIDPKDPDKEFWFIVRLDGDLYTLLHCNPQLDITDELEELNRTNGLFKFVRVMRKQFKEFISKELSPLPNSVASPNEMSIEVDSSLQSKKLHHDSHHKDVPSKVAILSPQSISNLHRSPHLGVRKAAILSPQSISNHRRSLRLGVRKAAILSPQSISNHRRSPRLGIRKLP